MYIQLHLLLLLLLDIYLELIMNLVLLLIFDVLCMYNMDYYLHNIHKNMEEDINILHLLLNIQMMSLNVNHQDMLNEDQ